MKAFISLILAVFVAFIAIAPTGKATDTPSPQADLAGALGTLTDAAGRAFIAIDAMGYAVDSAMHAAPPIIRALYGAARCASGVLVLVGISALLSARRVAQRFNRL